MISARAPLVRVVRRANIGSFPAGGVRPGVARRLPQVLRVRPSARQATFVLHEGPPGLLQAGLRQVSMLWMFGKRCAMHFALLRDDFCFVPERNPVGFWWWSMVRIPARWPRVIVSGSWCETWYAHITMYPSLRDDFQICEKMCLVAVRLCPRSRVNRYERIYSIFFLYIVLRYWKCGRSLSEVELCCSYFFAVKKKLKERFECEHCARQCWLLLLLF